MVAHEIMAGERACNAQPLLHTRELIGRQYRTPKSKSAVPSALRYPGRAAVAVHDLRHSCATLLFTMGFQPATVQRILRHSSITVTTGTYGEVVEAVQRDALEWMGSLFAHAGDNPTGLSSKASQLSSNLSSNGSE